MKKISSCSKTILNQFGIQLIPKELQDILFGKIVTSYPKDAEICLAKNHLLSCGIQADTNQSTIFSIPDFEFPNLEGGNISEHFKIIAERKVQPYIDSFNNLFSKDSCPDFGKRPSSWVFHKGWTRYDFASGNAVSCDGPEEECIVFDVEVCVKYGDQPIIASVLSNKFWYSWCSPVLFEENSDGRDRIVEPSELISFKKPPNLIIGHNVAYDRARIKEEYRLVQKSRTRFLDTMSLHITVSGMTVEQRALKAKNDSVLLNDWVDKTSMNNLSDVYKLYCPDSKPLRKSERDVFVQGDLEDIKNDFQNLMSYCSEDTEATYNLSKTLFSLYLQRSPHPASLFGLLEFGKTYLPIDESWFQYIRQSHLVADELNEEVKQILEQHAREVCQLIQKDEYKYDPWMWDQNWSRSGLKIKKNSRPLFLDSIDQGDSVLKFKSLMDSKKLLSKSQSKAPGYPSWFQELCCGSRYGNWFNKMIDLTPAKSISPPLLRLSWKDKPLYRHKNEKWGFLFRGKNLDQDDKLSHKLSPYLPKSNEEKTFRLQKGVWFSPLPHKDGPTKKVGNPLSKDFIDKVSDGTLTTKSTFSKLAYKVLSFSNTMSYWKSNRDRIDSQMISYDSMTSNLSILPQSVASGTITRRSVEKTWLTASNAKVDRVGSELKTLVRAPDGYHIVGADVDSQELWIAAVLGDASFIKEHGCTAMGWMTLQGNKNDGTDMHSKTAQVVGVSRDQAKILNYGRIYGAGLKFAKMLLKNFNPFLDNSKASSSAKDMYDATKGQKIYTLNVLGAMYYSAYIKKSVSFEDLVANEVSEATIRNISKINKLSKEYLTLSKDASHWDLTFKGRLCACTQSNELSITKGIALIRNLIHRKPLPFSSKISDIDDVISYSKWYGGSESYTFNCLEEIVLNDAKTPVLKSQISRALETSQVGKDFLPSRINWVVQSSGVDYMHLLLLAMDWLMTDIYELKDEYRFLICIHDEVRYVVKSDSRYRAAYCLHLANLMVRAVFCFELGMKSLPTSIAFFSGVDVDKVMRKDPTNECVTPSNPQGLHLGYGISPGESLTFEEVVKKL
ncbi:DNA polymerase subunit gamma-1, mitochondrial [Lepeophtheirus salmonis]|uniref:DNA polymerase subunit gamma-1, mitochondrial n=1 Tax=Lepeophtheirus salmonis TaxID=72036 RepID=UPI001AE8C356|nr:DNA polymerase subunit gamma-1-like [Lepeophtheirus salmonis]